ncbi:unnamed protein product [Adineta ricciae]|uniref:Cyclin N-terminal domain-containing protein n=2 Tax=Adineta ricciae TaxID=249248 RepID=A0A815LLY5_ADIRI|nr:unnamed protein product [Adineta ricciae]
MMSECEYLKLFIKNCKNHQTINCQRSLSFCNKTMASFFYMLTCQIELDDQVFFTSIELLNKFLICSMIKACQQSNDLRIMKEKCLREKYLITIACFRLATQICNRSIDSSRLIEYFYELTRIDSTITKTKFTRDQLNQTEIDILTIIDYRFPSYTPHMFISYFLRFLYEEIKLTSDRLYNSSMLLLVHIYLQWSSLIESLAKKESGSSIVNKSQIENVTQRFNDSLLLGSATILAASKIFCHSTNSQLHDKIVSLFVTLLGIDPMRIYLAQFFAEELLRKTKDVETTSRILIDREHDFDDESMMTFSSP